MPHLAFAVLFLAAALGPQAVVVEAPQELAQLLREDPCAVARRIAERAPCIDAEDCGAFQEWKRIFGAPRAEPLTPELAAGSAVRGPNRDQGLRSVQGTPPVFPCPASLSGPS